MRLNSPFFASEDRKKAIPVVRLIPPFQFPQVGRERGRGGETEGRGMKMGLFRGGEVRVFSFSIVESLKVSITLALPNNCIFYPPCFITRVQYRSAELAVVSGLFLLFFTRLSPPPLLSPLPLPPPPPLFFCPSYRFPRVEGGGGSKMINGSLLRERNLFPLLFSTHF